MKMEKLNSHIFKKVILPIASVFCSCALYVSVANAKIADEYTDVTSLVEQAERQDNFIPQKSVKVATTTEELASNIADYTDIEKEPVNRNKVKDYSKKSNVKKNNLCYDSFCRTAWYLGCRLCF